MNKFENAMYYGLRDYWVNHKRMSLNEATKFVNSDDVFRMIQQYAVGLSKGIKLTNEIGSVKNLSNFNETAEEIILIERCVEARLNG